MNCRSKGRFIKTSQMDFVNGVSLEFGEAHCLLQKFVREKAFAKVRGISLKAEVTKCDDIAQ